MQMNDVASGFVPVSCTCSCIRMYLLDNSVEGVAIVHLLLYLFYNKMWCLFRGWFVCVCFRVLE